MLDACSIISFIYVYFLFLSIILYPIIYFSSQMSVFFIFYSVSLIYFNFSIYFLSSKLFIYLYFLWTFYSICFLFYSSAKEGFLFNPLKFTWNSLFYLSPSCLFYFLVYFYWFNSSFDIFLFTFTVLSFILYFLSFESLFFMPSLIKSLKSFLCSIGLSFFYSVCLTSDFYLNAFYINDVLLLGTFIFETPFIKFWIFFFLSEITFCLYCSSEGC